MSHVTRILSRIEQGDPEAAEKPLPLVYGELRRLATQRLGIFQLVDALRWLPAIGTDSEQHRRTRTG